MAPVPQTRRKPKRVRRSLCSTSNTSKSRWPMSRCSFGRSSAGPLYSTWLTTTQRRDISRPCATAAPGAPARPQRCAADQPRAPAADLQLDHATASPSVIGFTRPGHSAERVRRCMATPFPCDPPPSPRTNPVQAVDTQPFKAARFASRFRTPTLTPKNQAFTSATALKR